MIVKKILKRKIFGFTIVELILVMTIIAFLTTLLFVTYPSISQKASIATIQTNLRDASKQLNLFEIENSQLPITTDCNQPNSSTNLCLNPNSNSNVIFSSNQNNNQKYFVTIEKNGITYNIDDNGLILAGPAPVLDSSADNYVSYNGAGNSWKDINTNSVQNGGYFDFYGSNNYISSLYLNNPSSQHITIAVWMMQGSKNGTYDVMSQSQWGTGYWSNWSFSQIGQTMKFNLTDINSNEYQCAGGQFNDSSWHYVVGVWDGSYMHTYINGVEVATCDSPSAIAAAKGTHPIGKYPNAAYYFNGLTGDIRVYDTVISPAEIIENFNISSQYYKL